MTDEYERHNTMQHCYELNDSIIHGHSHQKKSKHYHSAELNIQYLKPIEQLYKLKWTRYDWRIFRHDRIDFIERQNWVEN